MMDKNVTSALRVCFLFVFVTQFPREHDKLQ